MQLCAPLARQTTLRMFPATLLLLLTPTFGTASGDSRPNLPPPPPPPFGQRLTRITILASNAEEKERISREIGLTTGMVLTEAVFESAKDRLRKIDPALHVVMTLEGGRPAIMVTPNLPYATVAVAQH